MGVPAVYIDPQVCIGCQSCMSVCPVGAIIVDPCGVGGIVTCACIGCGACLNECPVEAIRPWGD